MKLLPIEMLLKKRIFSILFVLAPVIQGLAQDDQLGKVVFNVSGADVAKPYFEKGLKLLHHFEYEQAIKEFQMAQLLDPACVMAFWGEAMCYNHPVWFQQDFQKGRGTLLKLAVKANDRYEMAANDVEKGFLAALDSLYGEKENKNERDLRYEQAMQNVYNAHPEDQEAAVFYALSLIGSCHSGIIQEKYDQAAKILKKVLAENPAHPGAAHYLIRVYDNPEQAYKGMDAAEKYTKAAPAAKNACHMPTHIYLATGKWGEVVTRNEMAWKISEAQVKKNKGSLEDRDYHTLWWLQYGYLQQGRYAKAMELLKDMIRDAQYTRSERMRFHLAMMKAAYIVETGKWQDNISSLEIPTKGFSLSAKSALFFVSAMTAVDKNDFSRADWFLNQLIDQRTVEWNKKEAFQDFRNCGIEPVVSTAGIEQEMLISEVMELEVKGLMAFKQNKQEEAFEYMDKALSTEKRIDYKPGPPVVVKPASELYGDMLLEAGKYQEAVDQYDLSLQRAPGRSLSLLGKYKALLKLNETTKASQIKSLLKKNWEQAEPEVNGKIN